MTQPSLSHSVGIEDSILAWVREGLLVYDLFNEYIGTVDHVYMGAGSPDGTLKELPPEVSIPLQENGYLKIRSGLYSPIFYVLPHQIADITQQAVFLHVPQREIIQV